MRTVLAVAVVMLVPSFLCAQSLGDAAAREKERRDKVSKGKPVKVITESDLGGRLTNGTLSQPQAEGGTETAATAPVAKAEGAKPAAAGAAKPEKTEDEIRADKAKDWHDRLDKARAEVSRLQARVDQLQTALNDMTGPLYGGGRADRVSQLDQAKRDLATAQQQVASLEDEGRRNNSYR